MIKTYWVGDRPGGSWTFQVLNQTTGLPESLAGYTAAKVILLDSDNQEVAFPEASTTFANAALGTVAFIWPTESVFTRPGRYVMQLELTSGSARRRTSVQEILVKQIGGVTK